MLSSLVHELSCQVLTLSYLGDVIRTHSKVGILGMEYTRGSRTHTHTCMHMSKQLV